MLDRLVELVVQFMDLFKFWTVVDEYQRGVILRLGKFRKEMSPGLHWLAPLGIDRALEMTTVTKTAELWPSFLTLRDGTTVSVSVIIRYNIRDVRKALLEVDHIMDAIKDAVTGNVSSLVRGANWDEVTSPEFAVNLPKECRKRAWRYGIEIEDITLSDLCRTRAVGLLSNGHNAPQTHLT